MTDPIWMKAASDERLESFISASVRTVYSEAMSAAAPRYVARVRAEMELAAAELASRKSED